MAEYARHRTCSHSGLLQMSDNAAQRMQFLGVRVRRARVSLPDMIRSNPWVIDYIVLNKGMLHIQTRYSAFDPVSCIS